MELKWSPPTITRHLHCQGQHQEGPCITILPSRHDLCHHNIHPYLYLFLKSLQKINVFKPLSATLILKISFSIKNNNEVFSCFEPSFKLPYWRNDNMSISAEESWFQKWWMGWWELLNNTSCITVWTHPTLISAQSQQRQLSRIRNTTFVSSLKAAITSAVQKNAMKSSFNIVCSRPFSSFICFNHCLFVFNYYLYRNCIKTVFWLCQAVQPLLPDLHQVYALIFRISGFGLI